MPKEIAKPWTPAQHRLFEAASHDKDIADRHGLSQKDARKMAHEGVKKEKDAAKHPGGDTDVENEEIATKTPKHASSSTGFIDLSPVFNRTGSR